MGRFTLLLYPLGQPAVSIGEGILRVVFEKERYTPYASLSAVFYMDTLPRDIYAIRLNDGAATVFHGSAEFCEIKKTPRGILARVRAVSYSAGLVRNEPKPDLHYGVNLAGLLSNNISIPYVIPEADTITANYIYVKKNCSLWDAVTALCMKTYGDFPYLLDYRNLRFTVPAGAQSYTTAFSELLDYGFGSDLSRVISFAHMQDVDGNTDTFNTANTYAQARQIVRHKEFDFDIQWAANPQTALNQRINDSMRAVKYRTLRYPGYRGEDLRERITVTGGDFSVTNMEISRLRVELTPRGITTQLWCYQDAFCNQ
ncbi:MAG: hypothetical protein QM689_10850 [Oscillospiraceae bacterium]